MKFVNRSSATELGNGQCISNGQQQQSDKGPSLDLDEVHLKGACAQPQVCLELCD